MFYMYIRTYVFMCVILLDIAKAHAIEFFTYLYATSEV